MGMKSGSYRRRYGFFRLYPREYGAEPCGSACVTGTFTPGLRGVAPCWDIAFVVSGGTVTEQTTLPARLTTDEAKVQAATWAARVGERLLMHS